MPDWRRVDDAALYRIYVEEVCSGGHRQLLVNRGGTVARQILGALQRLDHVELAAILTEVLSVSSVDPPDGPQHVRVFLYTFRDRLEHWPALDERVRRRAM